MPDFKVLRGSSIIPAGTFSLAVQDGVDYNLEPGIAADAWWVKITNTHHTGMGRTTGGSQNADDVTCHIRVSGNDFALDREGSSNNCRVDWEIIQYIGAPGGPNEIKVRQKGEVSGTAGILQVAVPGSVGNVADVVPFITGQGTSDTGRNAYHSGLCTAVLNGANFDFQRGDVEDTCFVSYALVEFTGSNWTVQNEQFTNPVSLDGPVNIAGVADVAKTFIHCTYRYATSSTAGLDDASVRVHLSSTTQLFIHDTTTTGDAQKFHSVWLIENPQMTVTRYFATMAGVGEEEVENFPITAVADIDQTLTTITNDSTGSGTAFPRGYINHLLTSVSNVLLRQSDNGQTSDFALEIVELPEDAGSTAYSGTGVGITVNVRAGQGSGSFTGAFSGTGTGVSSASRLGTGSGAFQGAFSGSGTGLTSSSRVGDAPGTFQGAFSGTGDGVSTLSSLGQGTGTFGQGTTNYSGTGVGLKAGTRVGRGSGEFSGAFKGTGVGLRSASRAGQGQGSFQGAFSGTGDGLQTNARIGAGTGTFNQGAQNFSGTGNGIRVAGRVGQGQGQFTGTFTGSGRGLRVAGRVGEGQGQFAGAFSGTGRGLRSTGALGRGTGTFQPVFSGTGNGITVQVALGQGTGTYSGAIAYSGTGQGIRIGGGGGNLYLGSIPIGTINLG